MDKNLLKMVGAGASVSGDIEQATMSDFRVRDGVITKYIGKKTKFRLPDGIKEIGPEAFCLNDDIDTVIIPEGVTEIGDEGFATCRGLVNVVFPSTLKHIGDGAFMYCNLTSVELPDGLETIGEGAFRNCRNVHEITVPESVYRIGFYAFMQTGVSLFSMFSEDSEEEGATIRLPENFRNVIKEEDLGGTDLNIEYYGEKTRDISALQYPDDEEEEEHEVSELSGQPVNVSGKTYDHSSVSIFPEQIKVILPDGYRIDTEYDDDGEPVYTVRGGLTYNDEGEETAEFTSGFMDVKVNIDDRDQLVKEGRLKEKFVPGMMLDYAAETMMDGIKENLGEGKSFALHGSYPAATILKFCQPISIFGVTINTFIIIVMIEVDENTIFTFQTVYQDNEEGNQKFFEHLLNVIKAYRVNGKQIDTGSMTASDLERLLDMEIDEDRESISMDFGINLKVGDEETQFTLKGDGTVSENKVDTALDYAVPDESLYPHYNSMLRTQGLGMFGFNVVVNASGTEYKFYHLFEDLDEDASEKMKDAVSKIKDKGAASYKLADKAVEMRKVFHVAPEIFDTNHDRECELAEGMMHRAYMMSGLRSFAWTLSKYCDELGTEPEKLSLEQIQNIVDFVSDRNWLNYDGESYCRSLCGTADLHVYYVPDDTSASVKKVFEPSEEELEQTRQMQEKFPSYNPIFSQVGSLDGLRKDLEYIYPAIEKIYQDVKASRDYNEPLTSSDGDILYAWCALAYAARSPFFSEDGPMTCWFSREETEEEKKQREEERRQEEIKQRAEMSKKYLASYGKYFEKKPKIDFSGKKFVFSGMGSRIYVLGDDTDYTKLIEDRGGFTRKSVSGVTDYLVVDPAGAGESKISKAIENQQNGKPTKIILMEDLRMALGLPPDDVAPTENTSEKPAAKEESAQAAKTAASASKPSSGSSSGKAKAKKPAAGGKTVTVDNTWTVTIPEGYKYSTDKNKIGGHRNIIFMEDKDGNTFDWPFDATISFTSQFNDSQGAPAPELAKMMAGIFGDNVNVIRDDDDLYVGTYLFSKSSGEGDADVYKIDIGCGAGVSSIQVFFNRKLPGREEKKLVDTVAKSVRLVSEETAFTPSSSSPLSAEQQRQKAELDRQIEDLRSQAAFYSAQDLSAEDRETLANAKKDLEKLEKQMDDVSTDQAKFEEYLRQKEEKEKQREEERRRKEAEAMAAGKGEKDLVNMFVILCNEDKVKTLREKTQKEFFDAYGDCFPGYKTRELGELRKEVKAKIKDKETRGHFIESFLERSVEDRYEIATLTYFSLDQYADYALRAEDAIIKTAEWYTPEEMPEVRTLMEKQLNKNRREVDDAFDPVETKWKSYWSAKEFLKIVVRDGSGEKVRQDCRQFQTLVPNNILTGPLMVEVSLATKGVFQMSTPVMDFFSCYWDVSKDEIWEKASKNEIKDESTAYIEDINESVRSAIRDIKEKYPDVRAILKQWNDSTVSRAKSLVGYLSMLYEKTDQHFTMAEIKEKLKSAYKTPAELAEGKEKLFEYAKREDLTCLRELINSKSDIREIYDSIPRTLSEDIKKVRKEKELEESERRYSEAVELMSAGEFAGCIKAEEILKSLGDFKDSKDLLKQISDSIGSKKTEQYKEAVSLVDEGTEETIAKAIELMEGLGSYKDAPDKAAEYKKTLELERKYENALNLLGKEELKDVMQAREIFEGLGGYRDSGEQAIISAEKISGIKAKMYEEALLLEKEETKESLTEAKVILIAIKPYRDVEDRIRNIDRLSIAVDKYKNADEKASGADLKDLEEAEKLFRSIEDYKDAGERADDCQARIGELCEEKIASAQKAGAILSVKSQKEAIEYYTEIEDWYDVDENIAVCGENITEIKEAIRINHVLEECRAELTKTKGRRWKKPVKALIAENEKRFNELKQRLSEVAGSNEISISESGLSELELNNLKAPSPELAEIRKANEKGRKSARWRNIILIVFLIVFGIAIVFSLPYIFKPDLSEYESVHENSVHGMTYEIPDEWKIDDSVSDKDYQYYTYENNDKVVAVTLIEYKGEDDLSGKAAFDDYTESRTTPPEVLEIIPDAEGIYKTINKDHSVFKVFVYCNPEMVDNQEEFLDDLCDSFRTDEYENPRKAYMVIVKYNGDTEEGTVIDKFSSYIEVYEVYDTGSEKGTKATEWELKEPVTLKAGETSKLTVIVDGKEYSTDVICSTKPEDSKLNKDGEDSEEGTDDDDSGSETGRSFNGVNGRLPSREGSATGSADFSALEDY